MIENKRIGFIGAGMMGSAIIQGIVEAKGIKRSQIYIYDISKNRMKEMRNKFRINLAGSNREIAQEVDIVVIAVKPQQIKEVLKEIGGVLKSNQLLISIAAGIPISFIQRKIKNKVPLIRVMPNIPALVKSGISALCRGKFALQKDLKMAEMIFSKVGGVLVVEEKYLDSITAVSGSGPAYFYLFVEAIIEAGQKIGLSKKVASLLAIETMLGSSKMLNLTGHSPGYLRQMVTSPGGTTMAALKEFEKAKFNEIVSKAIEAALKRAKELKVND